MKSPQDIFDSHMKAVRTLNPDRVMLDYAPDALFITPDHTYNGIDEIKGFYKDLLPKFKDFEFITIKQETHDHIVYFVWHGKTELLDVPFATDSYITENGKIKYHTFAASM